MSTPPDIFACDGPTTSTTLNNTLASNPPVAIIGDDTTTTQAVQLSATETVDRRPTFQSGSLAVPPTVEHGHAVQNPTAPHAANPAADNAATHVTDNMVDTVIKESVDALRADVGGPRGTSLKKLQELIVDRTRLNLFITTYNGITSAWQ